MRKQEWDMIKKLYEKGASFQMYWLHLIDGSKIEVCEDYELPAAQGLVGKFEKAEPNEMFVIGDAISGYSYVPRSSIVYISTGDVRVNE